MEHSTGNLPTRSESSSTCNAILRAYKNRYSCERGACSCSGFCECRGGLLATDGVADGEVLATLGATAGQNLAAVGCGHSFAEAVLVHALAVVGLIGAFHCCIVFLLFLLRFVDSGGKVNNFL